MFHGQRPNSEGVKVLDRVATQLNESDGSSACSLMATLRKGAFPLSISLETIPVTSRVCGLRQETELTSKCGTVFAESSLYPVSLEEKAALLIFFNSSFEITGSMVSRFYVAVPRCRSWTFGSMTKDVTKGF